MKAIISLLFVALCVPAFAQTAKVIELTPTDAQKIKSLYAQKNEIEAQIAKLSARIADDNKVSAIEFSDDFRFAVPKTFTTTWPYSYPYCGLTTLAVGTATNSTTLEYTAR